MTGRARKTDNIAARMARIFEGFLQIGRIS